MTTENNNKQTEQEVKQAWEKLWEFTKSEISWSDSSIDFSSFFEYGKKLFNVSFKGEKPSN